MRRDAFTSAVNVVVAVKAEKVTSKTALAWALTHLVHPANYITLLAVLSNCKTGKRFWSFPRWTGDSGSSQRERLPDRICEISESCSQMVLQFHSQVEVGVRIKVVPGTSGSAVAAEAMCNRANWVVPDKKLKQELRHCIEELRCNIVLMKGSQAKVLRLNLGCSDEDQAPYCSASSSPLRNFGGQRIKHSTPMSSPEGSSTSCSGTREGSLSSCDSMTPLFLIYKQNPLFEGTNKGNHAPENNQNDSDDSLKASDFKLITLSANITSSAAGNHNSVFWIPQNHHVDEKSSITPNCSSVKIGTQTSRTLLDKFMQHYQNARAGIVLLSQTHQKEHTATSSPRNAVSLGRISSVPPPLCSLCQHKAPVFGKPPRQFSYKELEEATEGFSDMNFSARGGFGNVYRGILRDGQMFAVKLLKSGNSQAGADFDREVRVLSCAQHRNVVLLVGFCIDGKKRILVYEYICNGSSEFHLHGNKRAPLDLHSRMKIAIGTARGLRYLHEDCRVADFGLARWQSEWSISTEERVIGTSGYLAPEYINGGKITQKVDVYAFGVVWLELMTGQRISELHFYEGLNFLSDWYTLAALDPIHPLTKIYRLLDRYLATAQVHEFPYQLQAMGEAAFLCLHPDPESRPAMSKILKILEGDLAHPLGLDLNSVGRRSGHLPGLSIH